MGSDWQERAYASVADSEKDIVKRMSAQGERQNKQTNKSIKHITQPQARVEPVKTKTPNPP